MGPTASGKTALTVELAKQVACEVVSVDSALIYRGMDIGTSKPDPTILRTIPHHLIDICDPSEFYSAAQFCADATRVIDEILSKGKLPVLVGGTVLYFRALQYGLSTLPTANTEVRQHIETRAKQLGWQALHHQLQQIDPQSANRIHQNDPQRIQRALEVYELTGHTMTYWWQQQSKTKCTFPVQKFIINPLNRDILHHRIATRFADMLGNGLIEEIRRFYAREDLHLQLPSMRCVGYRQVWEYLAGESSWSEMKLRAIAATRQLAKRQLTQLRTEKGAIWYHSSQKLLDDILKSLENVPK